MQLRKNLTLYLSGIAVFTLTLLLLSTAFVLDESLGNRVAKIFWFYKVIIVPTADHLRPCLFHARGTSSLRDNRSPLGTRPALRLRPLPTQPLRIDRIIL